MYVGLVHRPYTLPSDAVKTLDAYEIRHLFSIARVDLRYKEKEWNGRNDKWQNHARGVYIR